MSAHSFLEDRHSADTEEWPQGQVLLIYQDFSTGLRARQIFEQTVSQLDWVADFELRLWRFELLEEPALLERAVSEAARAEMVFLSAHSESDLPAAVKWWLQRWLGRKGSKPRVLAVSFDGDADCNPATAQVLESLRGLAGPAGVEVFLHRGQTQPPEAENGIENLRPSAETRTLALEKSSYLPGNQPFAHWGIND